MTDIAAPAAITSLHTKNVPLKDRLSLSPAEASALTGIGLSSIKNATYRGALVARKHGKSTVILPKDLKAWLDALPLMGQNTTSERV
jgi:Helix-turn-helix domain